MLNSKVKDDYEMKKIILCYSDLDINLKDRLKAEAKSENIPIDFIEVNIVENNWKNKFTKKAKDCIGLIAIVTDNLYQSEEERWKLKAARDKCIPCIGIFPENESNSTTNVPEILIGNTYDWNWREITERLRIYESKNEVKKRVLNGMMRNANEFLTIGSNAKTFIPNFVNWAFSCELYLKTIDYNERNEYVNSHNLVDLYSQVKPYIDEASLLRIMSDISKEEPNSLNYDFQSYDLNELLEEHQNTFFCWRYIFEGYIPEPYVANANLIYFARALKIYIEQNIIF